jgi:hypothetical protein
VARPGGPAPVTGSADVETVWFASHVPTETTPVPVVAVASYARREGDSIRIVLTLHDDLSDQVGGRLTHRQVFLRLGHRTDDGRASLRVPVEVTPGPSPRLVAQVPVADVPPATWHLALRVGRGGPLLKLEARLLTTDTSVQPLALLVGPTPRTRLPEPAAR